MDPHEVIAAKVLQLKGAMSYRELAQDIKERTGRRITFAMLQQIVTRHKKAGLETIAILADYAGQPVSWFFVQDNQEVAGEAPASYHYREPDREDKSILRNKIRENIQLIEAPEDLEMLAGLSQRLAGREAPKRSAGRQGKTKTLK